MWDVEGTYPDYKIYPDQATFYLKCDKAMHPQEWLPPITWKGVVNHVEVKFLQTSADAIDITSFDFSSFPEKIKDSIPYIIEAIDEAMRIMD